MNVKRTFGKVWAEMLWNVMSTTGHGYKRNSLRHSGEDDDRRKDKLEKPNRMAARYQQRYTV